MSKVCSVDGCNVKVRTRGYCNAHYLRLRRSGNPLGIRPRYGDPMRFIYGVALQYVEDECLLWPFSRAKRHGYGYVRKDGKSVHAHRLVCELVNGVAPEGKTHAAHSCGNGHLGCVNKNHLRWATPAENQADRRMHALIGRKPISQEAYANV